MNMHTAVYPGSFDPVTYGHIDIIKRARTIFDKVIVACAKAPNKNLFFTIAERLELLNQSTTGMEGVKVVAFDGLVVDFVAAQKAHVVIRGLRMISDFEYEFQMALTNRKLNGAIETMFMMPQEQYSYLSSKLIKETAHLGAHLDAFVPHFVEAALKKKIGLKKVSGCWSGINK